MTEEERKEITHLICGVIDRKGTFCNGPEGLLYDGSEFCRYHGNGCRRVGAKSGRLRKDVVNNDLKFSLIRKKLKDLCSHLKQHPEKIVRYVCRCGKTSYVRCFVCDTFICSECEVNVGYRCGVCERCSKNEEALEEMKKLTERLSQLTEETKQIQIKRGDVIKLWKQKVWSGK